METERVKNLIIGSGEGGKSLAWHLGEAGEPTIVVERRWIGGSCPNVNCLPSKNEIWSAKVAALVHHAAQFGIVTGPVSINMPAVRQRKREMVDGLIKIHLDRYKATGVQLVMGSATLVGPRTVQIELNNGGTRLFVADRLFLNIGTRALIPTVPGLLEAKPLTNIEMLELDQVPEHLVVIGGGYVGLEFAQAYRRFGSRVTIIQRGAHLLLGHDADVVSEINRILAAEGIDLVTSAKIDSVHGQSGSNVTLKLHVGGVESSIEASDILVATGRVPNTADIGLDLAGIEQDAHGYLKVNDRLETTAENVWAIGECAGSPQFTHVSLDDFRIIHDNLAGGNRTTTNRIIPSCLYTDPPVAHIGLTETEAKHRGIAVRVAKIPTAAVLRTRTLDETRGFLKALVDPVNNRILGFTMIGPEAGEVMAVVQTAMLAGFPFTALRDAILAHPTMAEGLNVLFSSIQPAVDAGCKVEVTKSATVDPAEQSPHVHPSGVGRASIIGRLALVFFIVASVAALFAYAGGWLTPHTLTPARMIDRFEQVNGEHPGFRRNHAKGVGFSGDFDSNGKGSALSKASVFKAGRFPVIGRFALAVGQPFQADAPHTVRSMAIQVKLPDGEEWRSGMNNIPVFAVSTPQAFYELILAAAPDARTGAADPEKMGAFLARNPESAKAIQLIRSHPSSSGFANSTYNSLDAFRLIDTAGKVTSVRWSMVPVQPFMPISNTQPAQADPDYLFDALIADDKERPLHWHLMITVGQPGDPTSDATLPWPPERQQIDVGMLTIDHIEREDTSPARDINFDPLVLPNGMAGSDDPLLSARSAAYAVSFRRREGERKTSSEVSGTTVGK